MGVFSCPALEQCLELHPDANTAGLIRARLAAVDDVAGLLPFYDQLVPVIESAMWEAALDPVPVAACHALFAEMEGHIAASGNDARHKLVVVVPVADRPQHLHACLKSLTGAARAFHFNADKLALLVADDSRADGHVAENKAIVAGISRLGFEATYFGIEEQLAELERLAPDERQGLQNILGNVDPGAFYHKGASIMRNITCLMLNRMAQFDSDLLFLFVDSDQEFHANTDVAREVFTTNYFYHIDRIFRPTSMEPQVEVLTGKVVGDPPVSPAVMAGTLLEDMLALLTEMADLEAAGACAFHRDSVSHDNAAYHDMAKLFGFGQSGEACRYQCPLPLPHDNVACLTGFARRLNRFFDGEHPTRLTPYQHADVQASVVPARTVYTGNYVLSPAALRYFIPFASLQLRMAGPVLGRLVQASSGAAFVSANLPLLHRRTVEESGSSEFRPGVDRSTPLVELAGEFERQYFGDVMLFTVIDLVAQGYPEKLPALDEIRARVVSTEIRIRAQYAETRESVLTRLDELDVFISAPEYWWNKPNHAEIRALFEQFAASMHTNFGQDARAWQLVNDDAHRESRLTVIVNALASCRDDRQAWERVLRR
jgi:hypothetical protein